MRVAARTQVKTSWYITHSTHFFTENEIRLIILSLTQLKFVFFSRVQNWGKPLYITKIWVAEAFWKRASVQTRFWKFGRAQECEFLRDSRALITRDLHAFYSQTVQGIPNCVWEKIQRKKFLTKIDWLYFRNIQPTRLFLNLYLKMSETGKTRRRTPEVDWVHWHFCKKNKHILPGDNCCNNYAIISITSWDIEQNGNLRRRYVIRLVLNSCVCLLLCLIKYVNTENIHILARLPLFNPAPSYTKPREGHFILKFYKQTNFNYK